MKDRDEREQLRMQLAACTAAALGNTPDTVAQRIGRENPYWSASYGDVCDAVDRDIAARERADALEAARDHLRAQLARLAGEMKGTRYFVPRIGYVVSHERVVQWAADLLALLEEIRPREEALETWLR